MKIEKLIGTGGILCAVGSGILGLVAVKDPVNELVKFSGHIWTGTLVSGAVISLLGFILIVAGFVLNAGRPLQGALKWLTIRGGDPWQFFENAQLSDLPKLRKQYVNWFGEDVPSVELMKSWLEKCETAFVLAYSQKKAHDLSIVLKLVGSFKLLPLTKLGVQELEQGRTSGSIFKPEYICTRDEIPSAYYVGDLFADKGRIRANILVYLDNRCQDLIAQGFTIYARPFTPEGRQVMINRGFIQVSNGEENIEMRQLCRLDSTLLHSRPRTFNHLPR